MQRVCVRMAHVCVYHHSGGRLKSFVQLMSLKSLMDGWMNDSLQVIKKNMSFKRLFLAYIAAFPDITILTEILRISYSEKSTGKDVYTWFNEEICINRKEAILRHFMICSFDSMEKCRYVK